MDDYLSEREQVEQIRAWLKENLAWIVGGLLIGIGGIVGLNYMKDRKLQIGEMASAEYTALRDALAAGSMENARVRLETLSSDYDGTPYLDQARLAVAAAVLAEGDAGSAEVYLRAALEHTADPDLARVVRLRLARVLIGSDRADEALDVLDLAGAGSFAGQYHELRGDIFAARDETTAAREEYQAALDAGLAQTVDADAVLRKLAALPAEGGDAS